MALGVDDAITAVALAAAATTVIHVIKVVCGVAGRRRRWAALFVEADEEEAEGDAACISG